MRQRLGDGAFVIFSDVLFERHVDMAQAPAQLHLGGVMHNGREPGRHLCLPTELVEVRVSTEKSILYCVFSVGSIT